MSRGQGLAPHDPTCMAGSSACLACGHPDAWQRDLPNPNAAQGQDGGGNVVLVTWEISLLLAIVLKGDSFKLMFVCFFFQTLMGNQGILSEYSLSSLFLFLPPKKSSRPNSKKSNDILAWKHFFLVHFNGLSVRIQFCQQVSMAS